MYPHAQTEVIVIDDDDLHDEDDLQTKVIINENYGKNFIYRIWFIILYIEFGL